MQYHEAIYTEYHTEQSESTEQGNQILFCSSEHNTIKYQCHKIDQNSLFMQVSMYHASYLSSRTFSLPCKQAYQNVGSQADEVND